MAEKSRGKNSVIYPDFRSRSAASIPPALTAAAFANCILWSSYGFLKEDMYLSSRNLALHASFCIFRLLLQLYLGSQHSWTRCLFCSACPVGLVWNWLWFLKSKCRNGAACKEMKRFASVIPHRTEICTPTPANSHIRVCAPTLTATPPRRPLVCLHLTRAHRNTETAAHTHLARSHRSTRATHSQ